MIGPIIGVWKGPYLGIITGAESFADYRWQYSIAPAHAESTAFAETQGESVWVDCLNLAEATNTSTTVQGVTLNAGESILPIEIGEIVFFWVNVDRAYFDRPNMWDCGP